MDLIIGDESVPGYSDKHLNTRFDSKEMSRAMGYDEIDNKVKADAVKGASLTMPGKGNILHQLHQVSFPAYDHLFLCFGANDYLQSTAGIQSVMDNLDKALAYIRKQFQYVLVYGILPIPMYDAKGNAYYGQRNKEYYTLHDLCDMLSIVYDNNRVPSLDWYTLDAPVVTRTNYKDRLRDGRYPVGKTQQLMADRIAKFVKKHPNGI